MKLNRSKTETEIEHETLETNEILWNFCISVCSWYYIFNNIYFPRADKANVTRSIFTGLFLSYHKKLFRKTANSLFFIEYKNKNQMKVENIWNLIWFHIVTSYLMQVKLNFSFICRTVIRLKRLTHKLWVIMVKCWK